MIKLKDFPNNEFLFLEARDYEVFENIGLLDSKKVSNGWYSFSILMPQILLTLSSKLSNNLMRVSLVEVAYEELGSGDPANIHSELFKASCEKVGLTCQVKTMESLNYLKTLSETIEIDAEILGLSLGLEIIANENIQCLHNQITRFHSRDYLEKLKGDLFFSIHFNNEDEHIAKNIKNFRDFISHYEMKQFLFGFRQGLKFWKKFWKECKHERE